MLSVVSAVRQCRVGRVLGCRALAKLRSIASFSVLGDTGGFFAILRAVIAAGRGVVGGWQGASGRAWAGLVLLALRVHFALKRRIPYADHALP